MGGQGQEGFGGGYPGMDAGQGGGQQQFGGW
jgi:hypothetical protein